MVAGGDDIDSGLRDFRSSIDSNAGAACGVFAIGYDHVDAKPFSKRPKIFPQNAPARFSDDVADEEKLHRVRLRLRADNGNKIQARCFDAARRE